MGAPRTEPTTTIGAHTAPDGARRVTTTTKTPATGGWTAPVPTHTPDTRGIESERHHDFVREVGAVCGCCAS